MATKEAEGNAKTKLRPNTIMVFSMLAALVFQSANLLARYAERDIAIVLFWVTLPLLPASLALMCWGLYRFAHTGKW